MKSSFVPLVILGVATIPTAGVYAQESQGGTELSEGSAVIWVDEHEYKIRILCDENARPELGFTTEANRVTRAATGGQYNMVGLRLRPWKDTDDVMVSLDRYVAWMPKPSSTGGVLSLTLDMSPVTVAPNGLPVLLTYDMWVAGDRPAGREGVRFEANCSARDPDAPAYRRVPPGEAPSPRVPSTRLLPFGG